MENRHIFISAIKELGHSVSAADIAATTGLPLSKTRIALNKIALETRAVLEVSPRGEIAYRFSPDLESIYKIEGLKRLVGKICKHCFDFAFFLLRVSFGILLIASFTTIVVVFAIALIFILFGVGAAEAADGDLGDIGGGLDLDFFDFDELPVFFAWSTFAGARTPNDYPEEYMGVTIDGPDRGFFNNCFSFLFGEGDPNKNLAETQWRLIAETIRLNNGVVTAEQLAPYMLNNKTDSSAMLAVMVRFDGTPEVTSSGNLVYSFPSMQISANGITHPIAVPEKLEEKEWKFSRVPTERLHWVFFFAGANLCGAYALYKHLTWFEPLLPYNGLINGLLIYAVFFMTFPVLRELANNLFNAVIEIRNKKRSRAAAALSEKETVLKIQEAGSFAKQMCTLSEQPVLYTTSEDILPQDTDGLAQQFSIMESRQKIQSQENPEVPG